MSQESSQTSTAGKVLGISGFVLGICAFAFSFIPCLGMYAMYPGVVAVLLSGTALALAIKGNAPKGIIIAALIVSVAGTGIAVNKYIKVKKQMESIAKGLESEEVKDALKGLKGK